jgi:hypothetical protein
MPGLVPYLVSFEQLRAFAGSKDPNACMKIETLFKRELADEPGTDAALRRICMGEAATGNGTPYVWALEILCAHFGQKLPNASVANADDEWLMRVVDPVFDAWRLGDFVKMKRLVYGTWSIKIPHAESPRGGAIDAAELARALDVMRKGALPKFDREIIAVIGDVRGWLEACVARSAGLVAFYY